VALGYGLSSAAWGEDADFDLTASYNAFLGHCGLHTTRARGYHNWNDLMTTLMRHDLSEPWDIFFEKIGGLSSELQSTLMDELSRFMNEQLTGAFQTTMEARMRHAETNISFLPGVPAEEKQRISDMIQGKMQMWEHKISDEIGEFSNALT
jgi:hypothetical protein